MDDVTMTTIATSRCNSPLDLIALREISERAQHSRPRKCISDVTTAYTINLEMKEDKIKKYINISYELSP